MDDSLRDDIEHARNIPQYARFVSVAVGREQWTAKEQERRKHDATWLLKEAEAYVVLAGTHPGKEDQRKWLQTALNVIDEMPNAELKDSAIDVLLDETIPEHLKPLFATMMDTPPIVGDQSARDRKQLQLKVSELLCYHAPGQTFWDYVDPTRKDLAEALDSFTVCYPEIPVEIAEEIDDIILDSVRNAGIGIASDTAISRLQQVLDRLEIRKQSQCERPPPSAREGVSMFMLTGNLKELCEGLTCDRSKLEELTSTIRDLQRLSIPHLPRQSEEKSRGRPDF